MVEPHSSILEWLQQIFGVSEYLGNLRYWLGRLLLRPNLDPEVIAIVEIKLLPEKHFKSGIMQSQLNTLLVRVFHTYNHL